MAVTWRRGRPGVVLAGLIVASAVATLGVALVYRLVDIQGRRDEVRPADVIIVLGAAVWPGGQPSPTLVARTGRGIDLYKAGYAPRLLLTGGKGQFPPAEAEVMRRLALQAGVAESALVVDDQATSTWDSLRNARSIMSLNGWRTALVVSDPFHMLRARTMARDLGIEAYGAPAAASPTSTIGRLRRFYTLRESLALMWYVAVQRWGS
jgi:uncharacterized SAM-binding protein YcdF (DUF218 family)